MAFGRTHVGHIGTALSCLAVLIGSTSVTAGMGGAPAAVDLQVLENSPDRVVLEYSFGEFNARTIEINGAKYSAPVLSGEPVMLQAGAPALPQVHRSVIISDEFDVAVNVLAADYYEIAADIAPSKGNLLRTIDPQTVPYSFGPAYKTDAFFPGDIASLGEPYVLRDHRGVVVKVHPFQYNPVRGTLRVYTNLTLEVVPDGTAALIAPRADTRQKKLSLAFHQIYGHHFVNYGAGLRYTPLDEEGEMLIIAYDAWLANVQPLVDHRNAVGIPTTLVGVSTIGNDSTSIKNYIQNLYNTSDLAFVLLVGDYTQVAPAMTGGDAADPTYAKLAGGDDYPDIIVGRFSAESAAHVDTQVERTVEYETMPAPTQDWFWRATGIASDQGAGIGDDGEADWEHMDNIRADLLAYGYDPVDQIYDPSASSADVTNALNAGRGLVNYVGHGSTTSWSTTGFSTTNVNGLVNDNMLPVIFSVACVNGDFDGPTCFGEAWLRATNNGEPTGAAAAYMSSINQSWAPPMAAQDEFVDLLVAESYISYGALCYAGSCLMMDEYGSGGVDMFDTWHIFGDPALRMRVTCMDAGTIRLDRDIYACNIDAIVRVADCGLNTNPDAVESVSVNIASNTEPAGEDIVLYETGPATAQFEGTVTLSDVDGAGIVQVSPADTLSATYIDDDNGQGGYGVPVVATASIDCIPPAISNVQALDVQAREATLTCDTDEPAFGTVHYGLSCGDLTEQATGGSLTTTPTITLTDLMDNVTYYYIMQVEDEAGNISIDDNGGACYSFHTPEVPDFFAELFTDTKPVDLGYLSMRFTPGDPVDFYHACCTDILALPSAPGATTLTLSDDSSEYITLTAGTVSLYGVDYSGVYIGSNGYLTFTESDTDYTESISDHYDLPRVSALFDDLSPNAGGTVSYEEFGDRFVVTFTNVPEYSTSSSNTFQFEMFFNGVIVLSYLGIDTPDAAVGLSDGAGVALDFVEMNFSGLGPCDAGFDLGDLNCDGVANNGDIDAFVLAISDATAYAATYPDCDFELADCNEDGAVNNGDIDAFIAQMASE